FLGAEQRAARRTGRNAIGKGAGRQRAEAVLAHQHAAGGHEAPPDEVAARYLTKRQRAMDVRAIVTGALRFSLPDARGFRRNIHDGLAFLETKDGKCLPLAPPSDTSGNAIARVRAAQAPQSSSSNRKPTLRRRQGRRRHLGPGALECLRPVSQAVPRRPAAPPLSASIAGREHPPPSA